MPLQKCLPFKKSYKRDFWSSANNFNGKPDGFIKLLTKRIIYIELNKLVNMVAIFMVAISKDYWFKSGFSKYKKNFFN